MMKYLFTPFLGVFFLILLFPIKTFADVKINEVAWMGTDKSQYSEWLELYNDGTEAVSLAGWKLYVTGGDVLYTLSKSIAAGGYLLVERTTASAPDAVPGITDEAGAFGSGGLSNTGENLTLKDASGATIDNLSYSSGWPAGDASTHDTMQWNGQKWITAPATPDAANTSQDTTPVTTPTPTKTSSTTATTSPTSTTTTKKTTSASTKTVTTKSKISIVAEKTLFQGVRNEFDATVDLPETLKSPQGYFYWNMGDGTMYIQSVLNPIGYAYHYAGSYTITLAYYASPASSKPYLQTTAAVTVSVPTATIEAMNNGTVLQITNSSTKAMDIGQWPITTTLGTSMLPPLTIIAAKAHILVTAQSLGLSVIQNPVLHTPDGTIVLSKVASTKKKK